jgi:2'-5' RNA ligase
MSPAGSVVGDATLRLFLALQLPDDVCASLARWARRSLDGVRLVRADALHVTLAFLGRRPRDELEQILAVLRAGVAAAHPIALAPSAWRETRSVGMVVLDDRDGAAGALARDLHVRLEALGVYRPERRPWLAHVTVARWHEPPHLRLAAPRVGTFVPSGAAAYISRLHPSGARYEVLESMPLPHTETPERHRAQQT